MKLTAKPKYFFEPDWNGNLKLPNEERVQIEIIRPKAEERGTLVFAETTQELGTKAGGTDAFIRSVSIRTKFNVRDILLKHVGEVKNLVVEEEVMVDGKETTRDVEIKNGGDLSNSVAFGLSRLVDLICTEVTSDAITASEKKSS